MARKLSNNAQVAHYFANNVHDDGEGSNFFFEGDRLYSYGKHFCVARRLSNGIVLVTTRRYSNTTAKHIALARSALIGRSIVYCNDPDGTAHANMEVAKGDIEALLMTSTKKGIRQTTVDRLRADALYAAEKANKYLEALPDDERGKAQPIDTTQFDAWRDTLVVAQREKDAKEAADKAARAERERARMALWRAGEVSTDGMWNLPPALRLSNGQVQTSHGAAIPVDDAVSFWPLVQLVRNGQRTSEEAKAMMNRLGVYTLTRIESDGSIVVGCHSIAYSELKMIADQLSLRGINHGL